MVFRRSVMSNRKLYALPPYWVGVWTLLLCEIVLLVMVSLGAWPDIAYSAIKPWMVAIVVAYGFIESAVCFDFFEEYLLVKVFVIPVRKIYWKKVNCAVYISGKSYKPLIKSSKDMKRPSFFILSTYPGKPYYPSSSKIRLRNPFTTIKVKLHKDDDESVVNVLSFCVDIVKKNPPSA